MQASWDEEGGVKLLGGFATGRIEITFLGEHGGFVFPYDEGALESPGAMQDLIQRVGELIKQQLAQRYLEKRTAYTKAAYCRMLGNEVECAVLGKSLPCVCVDELPRGVRKVKCSR